MGFVQIVEFKTSRIAEVRAIGEEWAAATEGKRTAISEVDCADRDRSGTYLMIVEFPSYEAAMENSKLPETQALAEKMAKLFDEPPTYRDLDVLGRLDL